MPAHVFGLDLTTTKAIPTVANFVEALVASPPEEELYLGSRRAMALARGPDRLVRGVLLTTKTSRPLLRRSKDDSGRSVYMVHVPPQNEEEVGLNPFLIDPANGVIVVATYRGSAGITTIISFLRRLYRKHWKRLRDERKEEKQPKVPESKLNVNVITDPTTVEEQLREWKQIRKVRFGWTTVQWGDNQYSILSPHVQRAESVITLDNSALPAVVLADVMAWYHDEDPDYARAEGVDAEGIPRSLDLDEVTTRHALLQLDMDCVLPTALAGESVDDLLNFPVYSELNTVLEGDARIRGLIARR